MRTRNILWPTDFSDTASHALRYAIEMANLYQVGIPELHDSCDYTGRVGKKHGRSCSEPNA